MTETFKEVFFCLFWFTADFVIVWLWFALLASVITAWEKHKHD